MGRSRSVRWDWVLQQVGDELRDDLEAPDQIFFGSNGDPRSWPRVARTVSCASPGIAGPGGALRRRASTSRWSTRLSEAAGLASRTARIRHRLVPERRLPEGPTGQWDAVFGARAATWLGDASCRQGDDRGVGQFEGRALHLGTRGDDARLVWPRSRDATTMLVPAYAEAQRSLRELGHRSCHWRCVNSTWSSSGRWSRRNASALPTKRGRPSSSSGCGHTSSVSTRRSGRRRSGPPPLPASPPMRRSADQPEAAGASRVAGRRARARAGRVSIEFRLDPRASARGHRAPWRLRSPGRSRHRRGG